MKIARHFGPVNIWEFGEHLFGLLQLRLFYTNMPLHLYKRLFPPSPVAQYHLVKDCETEPVEVGAIINS